MPTQGSFSVELEVDQGSGPCTLNEVTDTVTGRVYAVSRAGDEYKVKMTGPGTKHVGAIIQVDGIPHRDDFRKTPFTYFKKPYSDPGFWVDPAKGKVKSRVFGCPDQVESDAAGAATASTADDIGVIRVFFFDVHRLNEEVALDRRYVAPDAPKIQEGKKWYLASNNTRYALEKKAAKAGCKFQITDRSRPLAVIEVRYKDEMSLKLLGWDGVSPEFAFKMPGRPAQPPRSATPDGDGSKRRKIEQIDLTVDDDDESDADTLDVVEQKKPTPVAIPVDDDE
eukprot:m.108437 g.108437  ORF g.108437 m.108437 type:complete len:281 (-) comp10659_c0_seq2:2461-3303(-)